MTTLKETTVDTASSIEAKMARMFGAHERILVLPVDHGMALGNVSGLDDPVGLVLDFLKVEGVNGVLCSLPVGRRLSRAGMAEDRFRLVTLDSALGGGDGSIWQVRVTRAADAAKVLMAWEDDLASRARILALVAHALDEGHDAGLPVIVEPLASGPLQGVALAEVERRELEGARIAVEAGADIIKMKAWASDAGKRFVSTCPVPVVALGGQLSGQSGDVVDTIKMALDIGMRGIFVGRNIWQRPRTEALTLMEKVSKVVHG
jgi:DhnA family fructose-bisphosphate aldolase class Ia